MDKGGTHINQSLKKRKTTSDKTEIGRWATTYTQTLRENAKKAQHLFRSLEDSREELVRQGKLRKVIITIPNGYKIHYEKV